MEHGSHAALSQRTPGLARVVLLAVLWSSAGLWAQHRSIRFDRLTVDHGLSQDTVNCILQDRVGFLWFGTQDGLNRYDGYSLRVYKKDPTDPASLAGNWVTALAEDPAGDIWIGTEGGGLARWHRATDTFSHYRHDPEEAASLPSNRIRVLLFDRRGALWIGTFQSGLARLAGGPSERAGAAFEVFRHDPADATSLADDRVRALYEDRGGRLWIGTLAGLDLFVDAGGATGSFVRTRHDPADPASLSDDRVTAILEDHLGSLWVGTENGLNRRDPAAIGFVRYLSDAADPASLSHGLVWSLFEDSERRLWIGTDAGLNLLRSHAGVFARYLSVAADPDSLSSGRVMTVFQDRGGVLWVGTAGGGLSKWNPLTWSFAHYRADPGSAAGLSSNAVFAFSEDSAGRLWIGTFGGGLNVFDGAQFRHYRYDPRDPGSLSDDRVMALLHGRDGVLWAGTAAGGLNRLDPFSGPSSSAEFRHYRHDPARADSLADDNVTALFEDRRGTLWVGTFRGGLNRLDAPGDAGAGSFTRFRRDPDDPTSLSTDQVMAFADGPGDTLWVGTFGGGLNRFAGSPSGAGGAFERFRHDPARPSSLSSDAVYALHNDAAGALWIGTQVGLNKLDAAGASPGDAVFVHYFERDGLPNDVIWGVYSDSRGRLWLSTNNGLSRFDPRQETFKNYDRSHGLQGSEFNFGAHFQNRKGELFFGGTNGFNAFDPERIARNASVPPVVLTAFTKLNQPVALERPVFDVEEITLDYRDDIVSFELAALDYTAPEKNQYRYKLEGFHDDWIDNGHRRRLSFTNLDPGRYVLRVQGSNNDGVWNEAGAAIRITIEPPFWQTWWFRLAGFLAVAGALLLLHYRRMEHARHRQQELAEAQRAAERERLIAQLEAKNAELERFTYTVSHDLKAPLLTIKGFLGFLRQDAAAGKSEHLERDVEQIDGAVEKMHVLLEDLLQLSRVGSQAREPQEVRFSEIVCEALEIVGGEIEECGAQVEIAPDLPVVRGDRQRLVEVLQNLLQNAVKYMGDQPSPRVEVGVRTDSGAPGDGPWRVFYVRDNGMGIEPQYHHKVFELFQRLNAETEGTGVGLALVKRIVEVHGGRIWVESEGAGRGSTFCFTLAEEAR